MATAPYNSSLSKTASFARKATDGWLVYTPITAAFESVVFEGGGVKGLTYVGVLEEMDAFGHLDNVGFVTGSSAGAMTASMVGLNLSPKRVNEFATKQDLYELLSVGAPEGTGTLGRIATATANAYNTKGVFTTEHIKTLIATLIQEKVDDMIMKNESFIKLMESTHSADSVVLKMIKTLLPSTSFSAFPEILDAYSAGSRPDTLIKEIIKKYYPQDYYPQDDNGNLLSILKGDLAYLKDIKNFKELNFARLGQIAKIFPWAGIRDIAVIATKIEADKSGEAVIFSKDLNNNISIADAVAASASFPICFGQQKIGDSWYSDGGIIANSPVSQANEILKAAYDKMNINIDGAPRHPNLGENGQNLNILVVKVDTAKEKLELLYRKPEVLYNDQSMLQKMVSYLKDALVNNATYYSLGFIQKDNNEYIHENYPHNTVQVSDLDISTLSFKISPKQKEDLIKAGRDTYKEFIRNYRDNALRYMLTSEVPADILMRNYHQFLLNLLSIDKLYNATVTLYEQDNLIEEGLSTYMRSISLPNQRSNYFEDDITNDAETTRGKLRTKIENLQELITEEINDLISNSTQLGNQFRKVDSNKLLDRFSRGFPNLERSMSTTASKRTREHSGSSGSDSGLPFEISSSASRGSSSSSLSSARENRRSSTSSYASSYASARESYDETDGCMTPITRGERGGFFLPQDENRQDMFVKKAIAGGHTTPSYRKPQGAREKQVAQKFLGSNIEYGKALSNLLSEAKKQMDSLDKVLSSLQQTKKKYEALPIKDATITLKGDQEVLSVPIQEQGAAENANDATSNVLDGLLSALVNANEQMHSIDEDLGSLLATKKRYNVVREEREPIRLDRVVDRQDKGRSSLNR